MAPYGLFLAAALNKPVADQEKVALAHATAPGQLGKLGCPALRPERRKTSRAIRPQ